MAYASRTGTRRNLDALRARGWGLLVSASGVHRTEGFDVYGIDNGAWTAHQQGRPWEPAAFEEVIDKLGAGAAFVVVPDVVAGGLRSLRLSETWLPRLDRIGRRRLVPVQDGMQPADVRSLLGGDVGVFVGGSTEWKLRTMASWAALARAHGAYCHVGRVNSARRIQMCVMAGADSFDGTSATRFATTIPMLDSARRQSAWQF
jgi:hypothetical protein